MHLFLAFLVLPFFLACCQIWLISVSTTEMLKSSQTQPIYARGFMAFFCFVKLFITKTLTKFHLYEIVLLSSNFYMKTSIPILKKLFNNGIENSQIEQ